MNLGSPSSAKSGFANFDQRAGNRLFLRNARQTEDKDIALTMKRLQRNRWFYRSKLEIITIKESADNKITIVKCLSNSWWRR